MRKILFLLFILVLSFPVATRAADLIPEQQTTVKARVSGVESQHQEILPGTDTPGTTQTLQVETLEGPDKGTFVEFDNNYITLKEGDVFYMIKHVDGGTGRVTYAVSDPYRLNALYFFIGLFILLVILFGGKQGLRGLISLAGSLLLILYVLLPAILKGYSPVLVSIGVASLIIVLGSYVTHGFNRTTSAAVVGMIITVIVTGLLAHFAVGATHLTGFNTDEVVYLNFNTGGHIDLIGLLLGGMIIGVLGVLYDAAISQAIAVEELHHIAPHLSRKIIFKRAIRIGREHIGALVNTLAIAYVGVSLPILLLFHTTAAPLSQIINRENFATEIVRTMIGSIGLVLAVPITTLLAAFILIRKPSGTKDSPEIMEDLAKIEHYEHHH